MAIFKAEDQEIVNIKDVKQALETFTSQALADKFVAYETLQEERIKNVEKRMSDLVEATNANVDHMDRQIVKFNELNASLCMQLKDVNQALTVLNKKIIRERTKYNYLAALLVIVLAIAIYK